MLADFDASQEVSAAFTKLFQRRNWLLGAPTFAGTVLILILFVAAFFALMGPDFIRAIQGAPTQPDVSPARIAWFAVTFGVAFLVVIAIHLFTYGWTLVAAEPAWQGDEPAFDRGFNRAVARLPQLVAFAILVALMAIVSVITIVGPIVVWFLSMYGIPYILFENRSATGAIAASFRLASENVGETVVLVLWLFLAGIAVGIAGLILSFIPILGFFAQLGLQWLMTGFTALAIVRFYDVLNTRGPRIPIVPATSV